MKNYMIKIKLFISNNRALIITSGFAILFFILWFITAQNLNLSDLFLNLLAGFIASAITIGVVERIIIKSEEVKTLPIRQAVYRDVQLYLSKIIHLWTEMYVQSQEQRTEITIEQLFSEETMKSIFTSLDLEGYPSVIPKQTWFSYINDAAMEMEDWSERIMSRYSIFLSPELMQIIHDSKTDCMFAGSLLKMVPRIYAADRIDSFPRIPTPQHYLLFPRESDYKTIHGLIQWCRKEYEDLKKKGIETYSIPNTITIINPQTPPSSIITLEKIEKKIAEYQELLKNNPDQV